MMMMMMMMMMMISKFNGTSTPKGSYSAKTGTIMIATSFQVATVEELHCVRAFAIRPSLNKMSDMT